MDNVREVQDRVHVRYEGTSYNFLKNELDMAENPTNRQMLEAASMALSDRLGENVSLEGYVVDAFEENGLWDIHPTAKFGNS